MLSWRVVVLLLCSTVKRHNPAHQFRCCVFGAPPPQQQQQERFHSHHKQAQNSIVKMSGSNARSLFSNGQDEELVQGHHENNNNTLPATAIAVVVARTPGSQQQVRFGVAAQIPRKRSSWKDPIQHTLRYWSFLDDRRSFSHLDALLTRVAPLSVLHLGCTEKMEVRE